MAKPSLPRGVRDFGPAVMTKRTHIIDTIRAVFQKFGFAPLETPSMENLSVLTGKYGDEGDQLLFKILNSGDFAAKLTESDLQAGSKTMLPKIAEKGLRYDLTVPFARYVVMNRHDLPMPFKRFQIQPVWRADRPQRGRYREFYQCDADVVGTDSLLCEAEIVLMLNEIFADLGVENFTIKLNNRKILSGIAEVIGAGGREGELCVAIDKLDKIGQDKVEDELRERGFSADNIAGLQPLFTPPLNNSGRLAWLGDWLASSVVGTAGVKELTEILKLVRESELHNPHVEVDPTLARGLSYYTGAIFEVKAGDVQIGSISGGGRYDNLTGAFGMPGLSGVGISLGIDRIYDVMEELNLFSERQQVTTQLLIANFDESTQSACLPVLSNLRKHGIKAELYPDFAKMKKQFDYANKKNIPYVLIIGSEEMKTSKYSLKNMETGEQNAYYLDEIVRIVT